MPTSKSTQTVINGTLFYAVPTTCQCADCEAELPVEYHAPRLKHDAGGVWWALGYECGDCNISGEDFALILGKLRAR